ncbi:hypothetical protein HMJ29_06740 [Hymenobacter taeanensis]|uniref:Uncharacterized protein n=2 Tax=Hymenobacter TaxID=89966 RepID=A0A6M6BF89_9BACT|nr:hypothetical protein [Hymenobacter taeanensis]QJX46650.1 hypothetical protein HMJ29_06740 [Hymenobacter taeanensis]
MTPSFKQGNYFAGLRTGLNALMLAADPSPSQPAVTPATTEDGLEAADPGVADELPATSPGPITTPAPVSDNDSSGIGMGTLLLGALVIGGGLWFLIRMFRRKSAPANVPYAAGPVTTPDFLPNQPSNRGTGGQQASGAPDFLPNRGNSGGGGGLGSGMGGVLMTGAAAAAGAYLGNRMASGHDTHNASQYDADRTPPLEPNSNAGAYTGSGFPALGGTGTTDDTAGPDYFSDANTNDSPDYFSSDYDDTSSSSDDTGGGGFDDTSSNSGDW